MSSVTTITSDPAVAQYQLSLNKSLAKDADFNAVSERFSDAFHNPEVQDQIVKDIHELTNTIKDIKEAFRRIGESLVEFDNAVFLDVDGDHLQLGRPWRAYQTRFQEILDRSFDNASSAAAFLNQYSRAILTDVDQASYKELQTELQAFVKVPSFVYLDIPPFTVFPQKLEAKAADALQTKNDFTRLADDLRLFSQVIEEALKKAGARIDYELIAAKARLRNLQSQLEEILSPQKPDNVQLKHVGMACVSTLTVGAVSAGFVIFTLSPIAMIAVVGSAIGSAITGIKYLQAKREAARLQEEIKEYNELISQLLEREKLLRKYLERLETTKQEIAGLASQVDAISGIWQHLRSDMIQLQEQLALATDPEMPITGRFMKKIAATRELYTKLAMLLNMYAKNRPTAR
ncbi:hypothetical protein ONZ51_g5078 [Trametes cubensis]|uniref:Uncharacterized protein n=1 Tax=Trametes cubensis TaxID=1111947 RepID=A0AAD7XBU3_9APHY|nr:hypothetical protein ONZ51_g5078 [Trametes cubensis]